MPHTVQDTGEPGLDLSSTGHSRPASCSLYHDTSLNRAGGEDPVRRSRECGGMLLWPASTGRGRAGNSGAQPEKGFSLCSE